MTNEEKEVLDAAVNFRRQVISGIVLDRKSGSLNRLLDAVNAYNTTQKQCLCNPYWEAGDWRFICTCSAGKANLSAPSGRNRSRRASRANGATSACTCTIHATYRQLDRDCPIHGDEAEARRARQGSGG